MPRHCARIVSFASQHPGWLTFALALLLPAGAVADDKPTVFEQAKAAIARDDCDRTALEGFTPGNKDFSDLPKQGGVLIGFDLGVGANDVIFALRPIYLTAKGEVTGRDQGRFSIGGRQDKVKRVVQVKAKPGYAVAKVRFQSAISIQCMRLTFSRLDGNNLDPADSYSSNWIGAYKRDRDDKVLDSTNSPIIGLFGKQDDKSVLALGLIHLKYMQEEEPAVVKESVKPKKKEANVPNARVAPAIDAEKPAEVVTDEPNSSIVSWLPYLVFGVVAVPMFLVMMLFMGKKKPTQVAQRPRRPRPPKEPGADDAEEIPLVYPTDAEEPKDQTPRQEAPRRLDADDYCQAVTNAPDGQDDNVTAVSLAEHCQAMKQTPAAQTEEVTEVGPADPRDPYWNSEELMKKAIGPQGPSSGAASASIFIGVCALFFWCLPILGVPISITGLVFGILGLKSSRPGKAMVGVALNGLGLIFAIINGAAGVYLAMKKHGGMH
ncbi:MAG TPA: hypothetical protein VKS79_09825 [Gemmataceae bacterium]|nr:hypothetical protein [Gemmataceae bacterium]